MTLESLRPPRVLVVEDEAVQRRLLESILEKDGLEVTGVGSGQEALDAVAASPPDVILLDVEMPGLTGHDVCERLRHQESTCRIPIVFVTGSPDSGGVVLALALGGSDFVRKPYSPGEIVARVRNQVNIKRLQDQLAETNRELERMSVTDSLTGLLNRGALNQRLIDEMARAARHARPLSLIMFDVDYFKRYNDTHGHLAGDEVLKSVAGHLADGARQNDIVARFGGEEFCVVLPETAGAGALDLAERLCRSVWEANLPHESSPVADRVTVSGGLATCQPDGATRPETLVALADEALYRAKDGGRNCICAAAPCRMALEALARGEPT